MKQILNKVWHEKHKMAMPSTLLERVKWHEQHLKHCGCRKDLPKTIVDALKIQVKSRQKPGISGRGKFYHIEVRPKREFKIFRTQDVGKKGGLERLAGKRPSGSWDTVAWLVSKEDAKIRNRELIIKDIHAKTVLKNLSGPIMRVKGDVFKAHSRKNIPERLKPTLAMKNAQMINIKKAQSVKQLKNKLK